MLQSLCHLSRPSLDSLPQLHISHPGLNILLYMENLIIFIRLYSAQTLDILVWGNALKHCELNPVWRFSFTHSLFPSERYGTENQKGKSEDNCGLRQNLIVKAKLHMQIKEYVEFIHHFPWSSRCSAISWKAELHHVATVMLEDKCLNSECLYVLHFFLLCPGCCCWTQCYIVWDISLVTLGSAVPAVSPSKLSAHPAYLLGNQCEKQAALMLPKLCSAIAKCRCFISAVLVTLWALFELLWRKLTLSQLKPVQA